MRDIKKVMKYIQVQEPVTLKNLFDQKIVQENEDGTAQEAIMQFKTFLLQRVGDQKLSVNKEMLEVQDRLQKAISNAEGYISLETSDWKHLVDVINNPSAPYNPLFARCLLPFMKAVEQASDEKE